MSLLRLNTIVMSGVVPFNFGTTYNDWLEQYDAHHEKWPMLYPTDPRTWDEKTREYVNRRAEWESRVVDELMEIEPYEEFSARLDYYEAHPFEANPPWED